MKNIIFTRRNGYMYTDAVRDRNPAHQTDAEAQKLGLEKAIIPGMWLASHIQPRNNISSIKQIKFSGNVFYEESVVMDEVLKGIGKGRDYVFKKGKEVVCSVNGVRFGDYSPAVKPLEEILHIYDAEACPERVALWLSSIGYQPDLGDSPEMYLASLFAPALLSFGVQIGLVGVHASQSFNMHETYKPGIIKISIGDEKVKGPLRYFELRALQNERIIASGRAGVVSLSELEEKTE